MPKWINMRNELNALVYGDRRTVPQGFWAVLRIMRIGEYSQYWNAQSQEAIGGSKWNYDDFIVRCIDMPGGMAKRIRTNNEILPMAGSDDLHVKTFGIVYTPSLPRDPEIGDVIFEINKYSSIQRPRPPIRVTSKYDIELSEMVNGDYGRAELYVCISKRSPGGY